MRNIVTENFRDSFAFTTFRAISALCIIPPSLFKSFTRRMRLHTNDYLEFSRAGEGEWHIKGLRGFLFQQTQSEIAKNLKFYFLSKYEYFYKTLLNFFEQKLFINPITIFYNCILKFSIGEMRIGAKKTSEFSSFRENLNLKWIKRSDLKCNRGWNKHQFTWIFHLFQSIRILTKLKSSYCWVRNFHEERNWKWMIYYLN